MNRDDAAWWDPYSDQPYKLSPGQRPPLGYAGAAEYLKVAATALVMSPQLVWRYARLRPRRPLPDPERFIGLSVSPHPDYGAAIPEMLDELGARQLLVRIPIWDVDRLDRYLGFIETLGERQVMVNVLQDADSVARPSLWSERLQRIFGALSGRVSVFQIGNAVNRRKWGCAHSGDYLDLLEGADALRASFPGVELAGSSVIDFEPLVTLRTLRNLRSYRLDLVSAQLYVNRRGAPESRQYGVFDLYNKLRLIYAIVGSGNRNARRLWITETNWPLLDTKPYTPNSGHPDRTVDEPTQAEYLTRYYRIAYRTGWVERVYWWQLINPGYGLVDHRSGRLRKHPSYYALKDLIAGGLTGDG